MKRLAGAAGVALALMLPSAALAGAPDGPGPWADAFVPEQTEPGVRTDGSPVPPDRNNPQNAVGPAETAGGLDPAALPPGTFYSLGMGGTLTLRYENNIFNDSGADFDLDVREVTYAPPDPRYPPETGDVYVSPDGVNYTKAATGINRDTLVRMPASVRVARFVKVVDTTDPRAYTGRTTPGDGIDIDGIRALDTEGNPGTWSCRASSIRITNPGIVPLLIEPSVANGQDTPCRTDSDAIVDFAGFTPLNVNADVASADTAAGPPPTADASVANLSAFSGTSLPATSATLLAAHAEGSCGGPYGFNPQLSGTSTVVDATVGPIGPINGDQSQTLTIPMVATVYFNRQIVTTAANGQRLTRRALEIRTNDPLSALGVYIPDVVVAEAIANYEGNPCLA